MLFPDLRPTKNGYVKNVSRRFNEQHLRELRLDHPTKRLVSLSHTFITRMSEKNVQPAMLMAAAGCLLPLGGLRRPNQPRDSAGQTM